MYIYISMSMYVNDYLVTTFFPGCVAKGSRFTFWGSGG